jgi:hypothetical protein
MTMIDIGIWNDKAWGRGQISLNWEGGMRKSELFDFGL